MSHPQLQPCANSVGSCRSVLNRTLAKPIPSVQFFSRGPGFSVFLTETDAVLKLQIAGSSSPVETLAKGSPGDAGSQGHRTATLRMKLVGAQPRTAAAAGLDPLPGTVSYFIGNNPEEWMSNIPTFARVQIPAVYPGVDVVYYGNQRQLEYDFVVAPGADPWPD